MAALCGQDKKEEEEEGNYCHCNGLPSTTTTTSFAPHQKKEEAPFLFGESPPYDVPTGQIENQSYDVKSSILLFLLGEISTGPVVTWCLGQLKMFSSV